MTARPMRGDECNACTHCYGSGADPEDEGDYDYAVHMHNPFTVGPCPECNGTGKTAGAES